MSPRYTRPLPEKIMAVVGTFIALSSELGERIDDNDPIVQAELIRSSVTLALASDTKDVPVDFLIPKSPAKEAADRFQHGAQDEDADHDGDTDEQ